MAQKKATTQRMAQLFLQSVSIGENEIPRSMITTSSYVESMSMKAPVLSLSIRDVSSYISNEMGLKRGTPVTVKMGGGADQNGEMWAESMIVLAPPQRSDVLTLILVPTALYEMCQPAAKPQFFINKQPANTLKSLVPASVKISSDNFPKLATYHLNMSQKPTSLLRQISEDNGARVWLARGQLYLRLLNTLQAQKPTFTYEMNNPHAALTITKASNINQDSAYLNNVRHRFTGYSETEGFISVGNPSWPVKHVSSADRATLKNMTYTLIPKLDAECEGNPALTVGMVIAIQMHRYDSESGLDETVPKNMIIMSVTHHEDRRAYFCRMILGVVASA